MMPIDEQVYVSKWDLIYLLKGLFTINILQSKPSSIIPVMISDGVVQLGALSLVTNV